MSTATQARPRKSPRAEDQAPAATTRKPVVSEESVVRNELRREKQARQQESVERRFIASVMKARRAEEKAKKAEELNRDKERREEITKLRAELKDLKKGWKGWQATARDANREAAKYVKPIEKLLAKISKLEEAMPITGKPVNSSTAFEPTTIVLDDDIPF